LQRRLFGIIRIMQQKANAGAASLWRLGAMVSAVTIGLLLTACHSPAGRFSSASEFVPAAAVSATNSIIEGDILSITFQYSTNYNSTQKVAIDGTINLEGVGQLKASGRSPQRLQQEIAKLYQPIIKDDVVTVRVANTAASIYISGAVLRPGKIPFDRPMTILEAIMEAGGFDPTRARLSAVRVVRIEQGKQRIYQLDLREALREDGRDPFYLKAFDIVHVPLKTFNF